ncbi:LamG domain-containing protein [Ekhidna sp.]|uniref:LamG domain-containing protein n=1 Tax=Ekhidna sp. TaxID=2608089 RepID=UPI003B5B0A38
MNDNHLVRSLALVIFLFIGFITNAQNQALDLSGAGNEVNVNYDLLTTGFTVEQWVYFPNSITQNTSLINQTVSNTARPLDAYVTSTGQVSFWIGDDVSSLEGLSGVGAITANTWHHVAIVYDPSSTGTEGQLYLDGSPTPAATVSYNVGTATNDNQVRIGRRADGLEGDDIYFDEVRIWNSPRSGAQISANYDTNLDPATTGLDVYLKFDSGLGLQDFASGNGDQSGTIAAGSVAYTPGVSLQNNALNFDGTDDVVDLGSVAQFNIGTSFTFEAWINLDSYPSSLNAMVFNKWQSGLEDKIMAITPSGSILFSLFGTSVNVTSPSSVPLSQWVHIAASYDGVNANIYINGALDASAAASGDVGDGTGTLYLGGNAERSPAEFEYLDGSLDEVRFWNIARTQAEIHANAYSSVSPSGALTAYYDFNINSASGDNTGATNLYDAGGTGLDGTLSGPFSLIGSTSNWVTSNAWDNDVFAPLFDVGFPSVSDITENSFDITSSANEGGLVYGVVLLDGAPAPSSAEVKAGTGQGGSPAQTFFNFGTNSTANDVGGDLFHGTAYDVYLVAEDFEPNTQLIPTQLDVTTLGTLNNTRIRWSR